MDSETKTAIKNKISIKGNVKSILFLFEILESYIKYII